MGLSEAGIVLPTTVPAGRRAPQTISQRLGRTMQLVIAAASIAAAVAGWAWYDTDEAAWMTGGNWLVAEMIPGVVAFAMAGVLLLRYPRASAVGWTFLGCGLAWGVGVLFAGLFLVAYAREWSYPNAFGAISLSLVALGSSVSSVVLPQLFPSGLLAGWLWRTLLVISSVLILLHPVLAVAWNLGQLSEPPLDPASLEPLIATAWYTPLAIAGASLVARWWRERGRVGQQVVLFALVWAVTTVAYELARFQVDSTSEVLAFLAAAWPPVAVAVVAVAVVRYQLYDIRLIIRRAAVYGLMVLVLTAVFAAVYFGVVWVLSSQLVDQRYRWVAVMAAVVVVLAADPFRRRLRAALERRFLGTRGDPLRSLARLNALVSAGTTDEQAVYGRIAETVAESVRAPGVALAIQRAAVVEVLASTGAEPTDPLVVPLVHRGERVGELRIAPRTPGEGFSRADRALLGQLASQAAAVVYGLRRDRDIDALRQGAIEAMAEQRMTLGRDLHDGLAPLLAGAGLTADALRRGMAPGSPDADEAARLATRLRNASSEVRRIAHDLQPTGGGTAGLAGLVTDYVASLTGPNLPVFTLTLDELRGASLPATVELGMSRVSLEAINNVIRHAHASHASVTLRLDAGILELAVVDDGVGIGQPYVSGLGITSMRSRVEALGGSFDMTPASGGGTRLVARVPVAP